MNNKLLKDIDRRINMLNCEVVIIKDTIQRKMNNESNTLVFGLAKYAEQLTSLYGRIEELESIKEAYLFYHEEEK